MFITLMLSRGVFGVWRRLSNVYNQWQALCFFFLKCINC